MADEGKLCVCPQCGKKYKLKDGFEAKSFSCKSCGATVWVSGKAPAPAPTTKKTVEAPTTRGGRGGHGRSAVGSSKGARRGGRGRDDGGDDEGHEGRRHHREKKKNNTVLIAIGAVALVGIIIVVAVMASGKKKSPESPVATQPNGAPGTGPGLASANPGTAPAVGTPGTAPATEPEKTPPAAGGQEKPAPGTPEAGKEPEPVKESGTGKPAESVEGGEPKPQKGLSGGDQKKLNKFEPPSTLGHLESTSAEQRKQIDELIAVMFDPQAGIDSHRAKDKLAAIGKPAFLPILGKMAAIRDVITDTDSPEEKLTESSLALADSCLRMMDGYLDSINKQPLRPGTDKKYISGILQLHYQRWLTGCNKGTPLKDLPEMPGAFDASKITHEDEEEGK